MRIGTRLDKAWGEDVSCKGVVIQGNNYPDQILNESKQPTQDMALQTWLHTRALSRTIDQLAHGIGQALQTHELLKVRQGTQASPIEACTRR